jgi:hypothetical protein
MVDFGYNATLEEYILSSLKHLFRHHVGNGSLELRMPQQCFVSKRGVELEQCVDVSNPFV